MKFLQVLQLLQSACIVVAVTLGYFFWQTEPPPLPPENPVVTGAASEPVKVAPVAVAKAETEADAVPAQPGRSVTASEAASAQPAKTETEASVAPAEPVSTPDAAPAEQASTPDAVPAKNDLSYLAYYAYSEVPPDIKPADTVLASLDAIPIGPPVDEIKLAADAFGLDVTFMKTVAKIESDFDPKQRTGSYIGLFQLSHYEFDKYGSGEITNPRDNAIAAAYKFATAAILFEIESHKKATRDDLYLIHQQGTQGAAEHVAHPERIAWKSMCATDEGHTKGEKWCKRAIWLNTLPAIKQVWKSVDNLPSGAFVAMWHQRIAQFYARYSEALTAK